MRGGYVAVEGYFQCMLWGGMGAKKQSRGVPAPFSYENQSA